MRTQLSFALLLSLAVVVAACGGGTPNPESGPTPSATPAPGGTVTPMADPTATTSTSMPAAAAERQLDIANFVLPSVTVPAGTMVVWTNRDNAPHTASAGGPEARSDLFDSGTLQQGQSYSFTFPQQGSFSYFCVVHPSMVGTITVGSTAVAPTPTPRSPAAAPVDYDDEYY